MQTKPELSSSVSIIIAGVLIAAAIVFINFRADAAPAAGGGDLPAGVSVPAPTQDEHIIGSSTAPLVLIEYSDFECYYCMIAYPTIKRIVEESNGQIAWVMRHLPLDDLHPEARPAAHAAECIAEQLGNKGWWAFTDSVFTDQTNLGGARYLALAGQLGADTGKYMSCVSSKKYEAKIDEQAAQAQIAGAAGTPFTVIYGKGPSVPLSGALPYSRFNAVIKAVQARQ